MTEDLREKALKTARDNTNEIAGKKLLTYYCKSFSNTFPA
jgi:hypothetical protein